MESTTVYIARNKISTYWGPRGFRGGPTCKKTVRSMGHVAESIITLFDVLYSFLPAESPWCSVEESMREKGFACSELSSYRSIGLIWG